MTVRTLFPAPCMWGGVLLLTFAITGGSAQAQSAEAATRPTGGAASPATSTDAGEAEREATVRARAALGAGVQVESADERFSLNVRVRTQLRITALSDGVASHDGSIAIHVRRAHLIIRGRFLGPEWTYYLQLGFSDADADATRPLSLRDAYLTFGRARDFHVRFGQMKVPHNRQRLASSGALQLVDRSIVTSEFNLDRDVGMQVFSTDLGGLGGRLAYAVGVFGGDGRNHMTQNYGLLYTARFSYRPLGGFDTLVADDSARALPPRLSLTVAGAYNQDSVHTRSTSQSTYQLGSFDFVHINASALLKVAGFSLSAEAFVRRVRGRAVLADPSDPTHVETARIGNGGYAQAGYHFTEHLELVARYGEVHPAHHRLSALQRHGELGGGLNWYVRAHAFKFQMDYFWLYTGRFRAGGHQLRVQTQIYL